MANTDGPKGFKFVKSLAGNGAELVSVRLDGTVAKGDSLVASGGSATIGLVTSGLVLGVAAEAGTSGDDILMYPALPWYVFEGQTAAGDGSVTSGLLYTAVDLVGTTGAQEIESSQTTEKVVQIIGKSPNSEWGTNAKLRFTFPRSSYTGLEDAG